MSELLFQNIVLQPKYIKGEQGNLFSLFSLPKDKDQTIFLFLPSFAEELNRCRVMVAMQARQLAAQGYGCVLLDYYGTGDSQGDFSENHWEQWEQDVDSVYQWLQNQGYHNIALWGLRLGAMLALSCAVKQPERYTKVLLWQPVIDGSVFMTQFLRLRLAMLMDRGLKKETTQEMRAMVQTGTSIEVAGYEITAQMVRGIDAQKMMEYPVSDKLPVIDWFEVTMEEQGDLPLASQRLLQTWGDKKINYRVHTYTGSFFWQLHERELTPLLLEKTLASLKLAN